MQNRSLFALAAVFALNTLASGQTTWFVDDNACPGPGTGSAVDPFCSIQEAINAAVGGDDVVVEPGIYFEVIDLLGKAITLRSSGGAGVTTIDANDAGSVITCDSGEEADTIIEGFSVTDGYAQVGGGIRLVDASPTVRQCRFLFNQGEGSSVTAGGGGSIMGGAPRFESCIFRSNTVIGFVIGRGGGLFLDDAAPTLVNCEFFDNQSSTWGGAVYNLGGDPVFINCTVAFNEASSSTGGIQSGNSGLPTLVNCIVWGNLNGNVTDESGASTTINYSNIQGGWVGAGANNLSLDPAFVDGVGGDFRLYNFSPCIDSGDTSAVPFEATTDVALSPRLVDDPSVADTGVGAAPIVDIGAHERQTDSGLFAVESGDSIQDAINAAQDGSIILVEPGTYIEVINLLGKEIHLKSTGGPEVTTISGAGLNESVVTCISGETLNTIVEGFTIANGTGHEDPDPGDDTNGGGVYVKFGALTMLNCEVMNNTVIDDGGGVYVGEGGVLEMFDCRIASNAAFNGGGLCVRDGGDVELSRCTFEQNDGSSMAICVVLNSTANLLDCIIRDHVGGSIVAYVVFSAFEAANCIIHGSDSFAIILEGSGSVELNNCTLTDLTHSSLGAIVLDGPFVTLTAKNCIIWGNNSPQILELDGATSNIAHSNIQNGWPGTGNIDADPQFVSGPMGDYYLSQLAAGQGGDSPCVDAGDASAAILGLTSSTTRTDQLGDDGIVDMGYHHPSAIGACCFQPSGCIQLSKANCDIARGAWDGPGSACGTIICFPTGACCLPDGSCLDGVLDDDCLAMGGVFQGDGVTCGEVVCPQPTGACCLSNGACLELTLLDCTNIPGAVWAGAFTGCIDADSSGAADACESLCVADINDDGIVNVQDLLGLLAAWGPCPEPCPAHCAQDTNYNCVVDVQDLLSLLSAWGECS